ncbi:MAG TPA: hypothetical protein VL985_20535 [Stellaceae bacterium]|nr:hypothetical protein [Stellaceae bacterium]
MKSIAAISLVATGWVAAAVSLAVAPVANAGDLNKLPANQESIQSRIDQLAQPAPQSGEQPGNLAVPAAGSGSFPRSFLIPGTDTSIRIGGSIDGTMGYYSH